MIFCIDLSVYFIFQYVYFENFKIHFFILKHLFRINCFIIVDFYIRFVEKIYNEIFF